MINLLQVYEESWAFYRKHWVQITAALILLFLLDVLLEKLIPISGLAISEDISAEQFYAWLATAIPILILKIAYAVFVSEIFFAFHQLVLWIFIQHWQRGENIDFLSALKECAPHLGTAIKIPGRVLARIFLPLLILVPGVYLAFLYTFSFHAAVIEGYPGKQALERSRQLVRSHWKPALILIVGNAILITAANFILSPLNRLGGDPDSGLSFPLGQTISTLALGAFTQISMMFFYLRLRLADDGMSSNSPSEPV